MIVKVISWRANIPAISDIYWGQFDLLHTESIILKYS